MRRIGGSSIAAIMGMDEFKTSFDVWAECMGHKQEKSIPMRFGNFAEPFVEELFKEWYLEKFGLEPSLVGKTAYEYEDWCACHLDNLMQTHVVEYKTVSIRSAWKWTEAPPVNYAMQCQLYMHVSGIHRAFLFGLIGSESVKCYELAYDAALAAQLVQAGSEFWRKHIQTAVTPPMDHSNGAKAVLRELYPFSSTVMRAATDQEEVLAGEYVFLKQEFDESEKRYEAVKNKLAYNIGTAEGVRTKYGTFTYKSTKSGSRVLRFSR